MYILKLSLIYYIIYIIKGNNILYSNSLFFYNKYFNINILPIIVCKLITLMLIYIKTKNLIYIFLKYF